MKMFKISRILMILIIVILVGMMFSIWIDRATFKKDFQCYNECLSSNKTSKDCVYECSLQLTYDKCCEGDVCSDTYYNREDEKCYSTICKSLGILSTYNCS